MAKLSNPERLSNCELILRLLNDYHVSYQVKNKYCGVPTHIIAQSERFGDVHIWPTSLEGKIWVPSINRRSYLILNGNVLTGPLKELN